ncbi:MAG: HAMP domain-containing histidine kinase [Alphaproteobacteria bacterium]|nr:HAMP domain-containing histidine kinase [Alphaproteobacteria bacterium]MDE2011373.1 HAMP domain-containing histidine kinase [Alphaproteobacteria bacterium]MDE2072893.1 HAMP domain-containing histidine kinase [Alphaproteobacteria bacterium]MDE2352434.1 HAMP domain-containing histidine kinase [Alphaproteobacteria bacterium]
MPASSNFSWNRPSSWPVFGGDGMAAIIARRLLGVALLFALLDIGFVIVSYASDREGLGERLLAIRAEEIADAITVSGDEARFDPGRFSRAASDMATLAFAITDRRSKTVAVIGRWAQPRTQARPIGSLISMTRRDDHADGFVLHGVRRVEVGGQPFWITMEVSGKGLQPFLPVIFDELIEHVVAPLLPLVVLLLALNVVVVRRALQPLAAAVGEVETLQPAQIERRLIVPGEPREVRRLVGALNEALDRIERGIRALRDFTADAAHELRTPLAILSMEVDGLAVSPAKDKLRGDIDAMTRSVSQMLDMASADALLIDGAGSVDLGAVARDTVMQLTPLALLQHRNLRFTDEGAATITGHREALSRALRNLIENALAHTPEGIDVDITAGPGAAITVRDYGPGIPADQRQTAQQRFWRADRSRASGSGLGLAIAGRIAEAHGGRLEIGDAAGGGALIRLCLSRA